MSDAPEQPEGDDPEGGDPEGYDGVEYIPALIAEQSPSLLAHLCRHVGVAPLALDAPFTFCDLGCGQGRSLIAYAACAPQGRFIGVDLLPEHVESARAFARRAGVDNVRFIAAPFGALEDGALPPLDVVTAHGVYSWVPAAARAQLVDVIARHLKPGGLCHVSYNAMPGATLVETVREMLQAYTRRMRAPLLERARAGMAYLAFMREQRAGVFTAAPALGKFVDRLVASDLRYVVHEFFTPAWRAHHVHEVAGELERAGLTLVGQLPLWRNEPRVAVTSELTGVLQALPTPLDRQGLMDLASFVTYRHDLYARAPIAYSDAPLAERLDGCVFAPLKGAGALIEPATFQQLEVDLDGPVFRALAPALARGPAGVDDLLARDPGLERVPRAHLVEALYWLVLAGRALPARASALHPEPAALGEGPVRLQPAFNRAQLDEPFTLDEGLTLIAPLLGQPLVVRGLEALILRALVEVGRAGLVDHVCAALDALGVQVALDEASPSGVEAQRAKVRERAEVFLCTRAPRLIAWGLLEPAAP